MSDYSLLNKIVLFLVKDYIDRAREESTVPDILVRLSAQISGYRQFHMFSLEEANKVLEIAETKEIRDIMDEHVSYIIFALELMKLWTEAVPKKDRPHLNISDKHFKLGGKYYWLAMIKLKKNDQDKYKETDATIEISRDTAKRLLEYHLKELT